MSSKIIVVGIGAIGSIISHKMISNGINISMMTRTSKQRNELIKYGLSNENSIVYADNVYSISAIPKTKFDLIIISTKTTAIESLMNKISTFIHSDGIILFIQNGYIYDTVSRYSLFKQSVRGIAGFGGRKTGSHQFQQFTKGSLHIGSYMNNNANIDRITNLLGKAIDIEIYDNIMDVVWSKLAVNCTLNGISSVTGMKIGELFSNNKTFWLMKRIFNEVSNVAHKLGYKIISISFDPCVFQCEPIDGYLVKQLAYKYKDSISSTLQSIINGNKTEYDYIGGAVVNKAKKLGINVPFNAYITELISDIENGKKIPHINNIEVIKHLDH